MKIEDFHITLVNGEKIFAVDGLRFGALTVNISYVNAVEYLSSLLDDNYPYVCTFYTENNNRIINRIIPKDSILSYDRTAEKLTRKLILEKQKD